MSDEIEYIFNLPTSLTINALNVDEIFEIFDVFAAVQYTSEIPFRLDAFTQDRTNRG